MKREETFGIRLSEDENRILLRLASLTHRTRSGALRWLLYKAGLELGWISPEEGFGECAPIDRLPEAGA